MARPPEYPGSRITVKCLELSDGSCPVGLFLDALADSDRTKVDVLFEYLGDHYPQFRNAEKFKSVENSDKIFAFKSFQIRILGFFAPGRLFNSGSRSAQETQ